MCDFYTGFYENFGTGKSAKYPIMAYLNVRIPVNIESLYDSRIPVKNKILLLFVMNLLIYP